MARIVAELNTCWQIPFQKQISLIILWHRSPWGRSGCGFSRYVVIHGKTSIYRPFCYLWNFLKYLVFLQCNHKVTAARDKGYHVLTHTSTKTVAEIRDLCRQHVLQHRLVEDYIMLAIRHGKGIDYYCSEVARPLDPFMMFCYSIAAGK